MATSHKFINIIIIENGNVTRENVADVDISNNEKFFFKENVTIKRLFGQVTCH